jgi:hypothetical protein
MNVSVILGYFFDVTHSAVNARTTYVIALRTTLSFPRLFANQNIILTVLNEILPPRDYTCSVLRVYKLRYQYSERPGSGPDSFLQLQSLDQQHHNPRPNLHRAAI